MNKPVFKSVPNELITTTDGRKLFHSRSVAVVLVLAVLYDNQYYIAVEKRGSAPGVDKAGLWCLPCGYLDFSEDGEEAVKREVWEEIGLNLEEFICSASVIEKDLYQPWFVKTNPDENRQNVTLRYGVIVASNILPTLKPNNECEGDEIADAQWVKLNDINNYSFAFGHNDIIIKYMKLKKIL